MGLKAGDTGKVWTIVDLESPEYEVTFHGPDGDRFDVALTEEELMAPLPSNPKHLRRKHSAAKPRPNVNVKSAFHRCHRFAQINGKCE